MKPRRRWDDVSPAIIIFRVLLVAAVLVVIAIAAP